MFETKLDDLLKKLAGFARKNQFIFVKKIDDGYKFNIDGYIVKCEFKLTSQFEILQNPDRFHHYFHAELKIGGIIVYKGMIRSVHEERIAIIWGKLENMCILQSQKEKETMTKNFLNLDVEEKEAV